MTLADALMTTRAFSAWWNGRDDSGDAVALWRKKIEADEILRLEKGRILEELRRPADAIDLSGRETVTID